MELAHAAERKAFSIAIDGALKHVKKDREKSFLQLIDLAENFMGGDKFEKEDYDRARELVRDPEGKWMQYADRILNEIDPHVVKMTALNLGFEAFFYGTKRINQMRKIHNCNIPWLLLVDPTSACNLHCTGCWAAEYGNRLNLSYDELDSIITQGKELGVYLYMYTGGEPLVRKDDIIKLCEKHNDCEFHAFTNGTLVDDAFCEEMRRVGNLSLSISLEGFENANDGRRGDGCFDRVMEAMDRLKAHGLIFGTSICYTRNNVEAVTSDEFLDMIIEKGCRYAWYFHYMPVGNDAAPELCLRWNSVLICSTGSVRSVPWRVESSCLPLTSRMTGSLWAAVLPAAGITVISIPTAMWSLAFSSIIQARISGRYPCWMP